MPQGKNRTSDVHDPGPFSLQDPLRGQAPLPLVLNFKNPAFLGVQQIFNADPGLRTPYVEQFNLNVQHELVKDLTVQAGYVGKLGRKLLMGWSTNPALFTPTATTANIDQRRILQPFGNNSEISLRANSNYNGLQLQANKRFSRGFSLQGAYTFSRSLDIASAISLGAAVPNVFDFHSQYGLSDFSAAHIGSFHGSSPIDRESRRKPLEKDICRVNPFAPPYRQRVGQPW